MHVFVFTLVKMVNWQNGMEAPQSILIHLFNLYQEIYSKSMIRLFILFMLRKYILTGEL